MIEKILERLEEKKKENISGTIDFEHGLYMGYKGAIQIVQEVAKEYGNGWIPCSERLPEPYKKVLVYEEDGEIYMAKYHADIKRFSHVRSAWCVRENEVVAWMPFPIAPYQKGE